MLAPAFASSAISDFARDVGDGLRRSGQKELPSKYLYDDLGSALFEAITLLPEYGLTRADARVLKQHSGEIIETFSRNPLIVELGSGSGSKTRWILEAAARRGPVNYIPIDISPAALENCRAAMDRIPNVRTMPITASYLDGLAEAVAGRRPGHPVLVLFLGSTIGNFYIEAAETFLRQVRGALAGGDALLLGTDLVKPRDRMLLAYDDPIGVTAAFNLNLLSRMNRELAGDFIIRNFEHEARFNEEASRVEMHLRSKIPQRVHIRSIGLRVGFREGETIWTEASQKFRRSQVRTMARLAGFSCQAQWIDSEWPFAENLFAAGA
ncbi:MAG: L-histidine N(alpha)-methyltransferase [Acidobacteriota bacterium]|nr:L-histidine N(alpha)-methyltransferase [Acidobacteriota bacterium]